MLKVFSAFARQGWRGCSGSLIIELERRVHELKCWEIRTYKCVYKLRHWVLKADVCIFFKDEKPLLSRPGKRIGEQYEIEGIAQAETIRHKRDL